MKLVSRIDEALKKNGRRMSFYDLAMLLYPDERSHRYSVNGGPPGCYMALSAAIRRGGFGESWQEPGPGNRWIYARSGNHNPKVGK